MCLFRGNRVPLSRKRASTTGPHLYSDIAICVFPFGVSVNGLTQDISNIRSAESLNRSSDAKQSTDSTINNVITHPPFFLEGSPNPEVDCTLAQCKYYNSVKHRTSRFF